jgi:hypothetical protein
MQSAPMQLTQLPPKPTCTPKFNTGSCADLWRNYHQAVQRGALNKLTTDEQQAQIKKLNDQIQSDATAALQAKSAYATAVVQAKTAAHIQGLREGAGVGVGVTLLVFALRLGVKRLTRKFIVTKKPKARAASA